MLSLVVHDVISFSERSEMTSVQRDNEKSGGDNIIPTQHSFYLLVLGSWVNISMMLSAVYSVTRSQEPLKE